MPSSQGVKRVATAIGKAAFDHDIKYPAAAFAYYAFISLIPLLVIVVALFGDSQVIELRSVTPQLLTPEAREIINESLQTASGRTGAAVFALLVLVWAGMNMYLLIQTVIHRVERRVEHSQRQYIQNAVSILGGILAANASIVAVGFLLTVIVNGAFHAYLWPVVLFAMLTVGFLPAYIIPSRITTTIWSALPGAVIAASGWTIMFIGIRLFAVTAGDYAVYGVLSGIIVIFTSFYFGAFMFMLGYIVNEELGQDPGAL